MQVKIEQGKRGLIFLHRLLDEISVGGLILEQDLHSLNPRLVDLQLAHFFIAIPQVQTNKAYQFVIRACLSGLF